MGQDYIPRSTSERADWLNTYSGKLALHGPTLGRTAGQITATQNAIAAYLSAMAGLLAKRNEVQSLTSAVRTQEDALLSSVREEVGVMKVNPAYTETIGEDMGIVGVTPGFDPDSFQPTFNLVLLPGAVKLDFFKGPTDGVNIYCRLRGQTTWRFVARDTNSPYEDHTPLAQPGVAEAREYAIRAVIKDGEIGQLSAIQGVAFGG
jgi:hypothetical protein